MASISSLPFEPGVSRGHLTGITSRHPPEASQADYEAAQAREKRKRRRKILSCESCRNRKLQCDRKQPACTRCIRSRKASCCRYADSSDEEEISHGRKRHTIRQPTSDALLDTQQAPGSSGAQITPERNVHDLWKRSTNIQPSFDNVQLEEQRQRIRQLETALAEARRSQNFAVPFRVPATPDSVLERTMDVVDRDSMSLRGRSFKTQFSGSTNSCALVPQLSHLNRFTKETFENSKLLQQMRADMHKGVKPETTRAALITDHDLKASLPERAETDELIYLYIDTVDPVYHIVHLPTFWKSYDELWMNPPAAPPRFVALVLLMMACVLCLTRSERSTDGNSSTYSARQRAIAWIIDCETWIARQSHKNVTAIDFQIRALLWLAKHANARKPKRAWTEAGSFLRFCMSAGLHRNPEYLPKQTSQMDKEVRRRIWATAVDFELQESFDRGMVSAPWLLQSDTPGPTNLVDEDISSDKPFIARPIHEFTPSAFLALTNDTIMLRSTLNAVLNNIRQTLSFNEVKQYTEEIEAHLRSIPDWHERGSSIPKALLELRLRQYLLALHDRNLRQAAAGAEKSFSKYILLETSLHIVRTHESLSAAKTFALELYCTDALRVAVSVVHLQTFIDEQKDLAFSQSFHAVTPGLMGSLVSMARDKVLRLGREEYQFWMVVMCDALVKITHNPGQRVAYTEQAIKTVKEPIYNEILASETPVQSVNSPTGHNHFATMADTSSNLYQTSAPAGQPLWDDSAYDLDDLAGWTLEDWFSIDKFSNTAINVHNPSII